MTEAELLRQMVKSKNGRNFTRFSIKAILQNPVYLIADQDAYQYFVDKQAELFAEPSDFDGIRGILAYNRTDQEKGRAAIYLPINEWIVSVGQHPGIIHAKEWIKVQESLERNKSKAYRKPRSNEALLTGLLFCRCGSRMYPKVSKRKTVDGAPIFSYVCKMKERSQRSRCNLRNANGNTLDLAIIEQIKQLSGDDSSFIAQLEQSRKFYTVDREQYEAQLEDRRKEQADIQTKITGLVDSLAGLKDSSVRSHIVSRIEELHQSSQDIAQRIAELEELTSRNVLNSMEFDILRQLLTVFRDSIDEMSLEQKRSAVRTIIRKVIWDGQRAHVVLFGASDDDVVYPDIPGDVPLDKNVDTLPDNDTMTHWGEDSE